MEKVADIIAWLPTTVARVAMINTGKNMASESIAKRDLGDVYYYFLKREDVLLRVTGDCLVETTLKITSVLGEVSGFTHISQNQARVYESCKCNLFKRCMNKSIFMSTPSIAYNIRKSKNNYPNRKL